MEKQNTERLYCLKNLGLLIINLGEQLDPSDFSTEISLVFLADLQQKALSIGVEISWTP